MSDQTIDDDLRIQIVNYRTGHFLFRCLRTIFQDLRSANLRWHAAVVDNASGEDLQQILRDFPSDKLEIHEQRVNHGFGAGNNWLATRRKSRYILFLNPDTELIEPQTIERMVLCSREMSAQIVGVRLVDKNRNIHPWDHGEIAGLLAKLTASTGHTLWYRRATVTRVAWVSGAVLLIDRTWYDRLGGFDEEFFLYKEEEDLCLRLRRQGGLVIYDPTITVLHHRGVIAKKHQHMPASARYFLRKHFGTRLHYPILKAIQEVLLLPYKSWSPKGRSRLQTACRYYKGLCLPPKNVRLCGRSYKEDGYYLNSAEKEGRRLIALGCDSESEILDIGCGYGRLATGILRTIGKASYTGIDVSRQCIEWCKCYLEIDHPFLKFRWVNLQNSRYNPMGEPISGDFQLQFNSESFDVVYLYSVFTHMREDHIRLYLSEIRRVVKRTGRVFLTAFVEQNVPNVSINPQGYHYQPCKGPLHVVRFNKAYLVTLLRAAGFDVFEFAHRAEDDFQSGLYAIPATRAKVEE